MPPPEKGGTGTKPGAPGSSLGFQGDHTDSTTGSVILGPRQYDPTTARFTSPDVYAAGELDLGLATDELTGNRYLFAAANPVAYYEDGHRPGWCRTPWNCKKKKPGAVEGASAKSVDLSGRVAGNAAEGRWCRSPGRWILCRRAQVLADRALDMTRARYGRIGGTGVANAY